MRKFQVKIYFMNSFQNWVNYCYYLVTRASIVNFVIFESTGPMTFTYKQLKKTFKHRENMFYKFLKVRNNASLNLSPL